MLLRRLAAATCAAIAISASIAAQTPSPEGTGSISGRVTLHGRAYPNAQVLLMAQPKDNDNILQRLTEEKAPQKAATDSDGHYSFTNLAAGPYEISVFAPALIGSASHDAILVADGETVEGMDFALTAGGVITGTVTLGDGRPAINKTISVEPIAENKSAPSVTWSRARATLSQKMSFDGNTDDRGVYRIYGVEAGDYLVSVHSGGGGREGAVTYYPGVSDKTKAVPVKVKAGSEASGIDVKLGLAKKGYDVRGRVVDESGNGVAGVMIMCQPVRDPGATPLDFSGFSGQAHSNSKGEFKFEGVHAGKYTASVISMFDESNLYSDVANFEVTNSDASVEIKTHKGLSVSGAAVIEGNDDPSVSAQLPQVQLMAAVMATADGAGGFGMSKANVAPDGSFTITGLRPGKLMIVTSPMADSSFSILRVERGGAVQNAGIEITADSPVTDIKVVLGYRNCSIYGRVAVSGGKIPKGSGLSVAIRRLGSEADEASSDTVDIHTSGGGIVTDMGTGSGTSAELTVSPGGDFRADRLVAGEYIVIVTGQGTGAAGSKSASQKVTLTSGAQLEVNLILDLASDK
jgi:uncharacterized GH25 family protein